MNTDTGAVDYEQATTGLASIQSASSLVECGHSLATIGVSLGLPRYVMLHIGGPDKALYDVCHNVGASLDADLILGHPRIAALLQRPTPVVFDGDADGLGIQGMSSAFAVSMPRSVSCCVLLFGCGQAGLAPAKLAQQLGIATMAASHLLEGLQRFSTQACPFSGRELECLCYAAAGLHARETARRLNISPRTVEEYLLRCRNRLGAKSAQAAAVTAVRRGWLTHETIEALQSEISRQYAADPELRGSSQRSS